MNHIDLARRIVATHETTTFSVREIVPVLAWLLAALEQRDRWRAGDWVQRGVREE